MKNWKYSEGILHNIEGILLQVTRVSCINQVLTPHARNFSISFFASLLRTTETTWSLYLLSVRVIKYLYIHKHHLYPLESPVLTIQTFVLLPKFLNFFLVSFYNKWQIALIHFLNVHCLTHIIKFPFNIWRFIILKFFCFLINDKIISIF